MSKTRHVRPGWRKRLGLSATPRPDDWVVVIKAPIDGPVRSRVADEWVEAFAAAGIDARAEPYVLRDGSARRGFVSSAPERLGVRVLVRCRDEARATELLHAGDDDPISDEELERQALEAAPPPREE